MKPESVVQDEIRLEAGRRNVLIMRNNTGACEDAKTGRIIRYGLMNDSAGLNRKIKSTDLIGITPGGRFVAIEAKREGWTFRKSDTRAVAQRTFIGLVRERGGVAGFAASVQDFVDLLIKGTNQHDVQI